MYDRKYYCIQASFAGYLKPTPRNVLKGNFLRSTRSTVAAFHVYSCAELPENSSTHFRPKMGSAKLQTLTVWGDPPTFGKPRKLIRH